MWMCVEAASGTNGWLINVYAPHSESRATEHQVFRSALDTALSKARDNEYCVVAGDFNAALRPGEGNARHEPTASAGHPRTPAMSQASRWLDGFLDSQCLESAATMHRRTAQPTWRNRMIDHVLIKLRYRSSVRKVRTLDPSQWFSSLVSDHKWVEVALRVKFAVPKRPKPPRPDYSSVGNDPQLEEKIAAALSRTTTYEEFCAVSKTLMDELPRLPTPELEASMLGPPEEGNADCNHAAARQLAALRFFDGNRSLESPSLFTERALTSPSACEGGV